MVEIIEDQKRGRPRKDEVGQKHYQISATLIPRPHAIDVELQRAGRFILATNVLNDLVLGDEDVLTEYIDDSESAQFQNTELYQQAKQESKLEIAPKLLKRGLSIQEVAAILELDIHLLVK